MRIVILGDANSINVQRWQQGLANAGAEVYLLSIHIQEQRDPYILPIPDANLYHLSSRLRYFTAIPSVRRLIAQLQPDLVVGYFVTGYGTLAALSGFHPLVEVTSGDDILISPQHPLLRQLVRHNLRCADLIVTWAPHMTESVRKLGFPDTKIFSLPRGIPIEPFNKQSAPYPTQKQTFSLLSTRSLHPAYNIDHIIQSIRFLRDWGLDCSLSIVGDGPEREVLGSLVSALNLSRTVSFTGLLSNDELPFYIGKHDFYLSIITTDGVSASLLEAMAGGLFPIVFDNAANRHWIDHGRNGLLVSSLEPEHLAATIRGAAENLPLRQQAWEINRRIVLERGDLFRNTAIYLERFERLAEAHNHKARR